MSQGPRTFLKRNEANVWLAETFTDWFESLTVAEKEALRFYKGDGHGKLNEALRFDLPLDYELEQTIEDLDVALSRMRLPETVCVYRGIVSPTLSENIDDLIGDLIEEHSYTSTSLIREVAEEFILGRSDALLEEIVVPGGTNVGAFVGAPDFISDMKEHEILLPRDSLLAVKETASTSKYGILRMEVLIK